MSTAVEAPPTLAGPPGSLGAAPPPLLHRAPEKASSPAPEAAGDADPSPEAAEAAEAAAAAKGSGDSTSDEETLHEVTESTHDRIAMLVESSQHVPPDEPASKKRKAAGEKPRRGGKWTEAEENYAAMIIAHFSNGKAPGLRGGESLRKLLADLLQCSPMRITKKFSRTRIVRKSSFKLLGELTAGEKAELDAARARFLAGDGKKAPKRRKDASHGGSGSGSGPWIFASTPPLDPSLHASIMPTAVTTTVYGYVTKEEKTFVRVVTMMTPTLLQAFGAVCARHGVLLASYRLVTDEVGVAHVRMELESLAQPLPRWLLTAVEGDLKRARQPPRAAAAPGRRAQRAAAPPPPPAPPAEPPAAVLPAAAPVLPMNPVVLPVLPVNPAPVSNAAVPELEDLGSPGTGLESYFASFIDVLKSDSFIVDYCSTECQRIDWRDRGHRKACKKIRDERAAAEAARAEAPTPPPSPPRDVFYGPAPRSYADEVRARIAAEHEAARLRREANPEPEPGVGAVWVAVPDLHGRMGREYSGRVSHLLLPEGLQVVQ
ncbi:hypothetical protein JL722_5747 [Aureococcus anophagefferens]|nr:hypothetical protein JL722_5747 [Aureococcus anophagefferens]